MIPNKQWEVSTCRHLDKAEGPNKKVCLKCGRYVILTKKLKSFYYKNGINYLNHRQQETAIRSNPQDG